MSWKLQALSWSKSDAPTAPTSGTMQPRSANNTAALLVAHQSNFRIVGFTTEPSIGELAGLAHARGLPLVVDQGSGALHDLRRWGLPHEHTVSELLEAGADVVCFSGDKLLGGPQAGLVVGRSEWVEPLARHPLYRALRPDKTALLTMEETLRAHHSGRLEEIPLYAMLETPIDALMGRATASRSPSARQRRAGARPGNPRRSRRWYDSRGDPGKLRSRSRRRPGSGRSAARGITAGGGTHRG